MTRIFSTNSRLTISTIFVFIFATCLAIAQPPDEDGEEFDDFNFDDIPVEDAELDYIGFGGGYLGMVSLVNYDELNTVASSFGLDGFSGPMLLGGGGGFIGGIVIPNTRFGVYGLGGTKETSGDVPGNGDYTRTMRFNTSFVAAQLELAFLLPGSGVTAFPGIMIGRSTSEIEVTQTRKAGSSFGNVFDPPGFNAPGTGSDPFVQYGKITRNSLYLQPTATLDWALNSFLLVRGGVGYSLNLSGSWTDPAGTEVTDVPDISEDGLNIHFGIFVGLFQK